MNYIKTIRNLVAHNRFQHVVIFLIIFNAIILGLETSPAIMSRYGDYLLTLNLFLQCAFVVEIILRIVSYFPKPAEFFRNGWNIFDLSVIVFSLLPLSGAFAGVARLARVLRVVRIVSVSPNLRLIIETMILSIPSMGHVVILLSLLLYVYGIIGFYLFSAIDPAYWGTLSQCLLTLFQIITLEGWVEIQNKLLPTHPYAWVYFASFITIAVFVVINLFIAVVTNNLQSVKAEENRGEGGLTDEIELLKKCVERMEQKSRSETRKTA